MYLLYVKYPNCIDSLNNNFLVFILNDHTTFFMVNDRIYKQIDQKCSDC